MGEGDHRLRVALEGFTPGARAELLRALTSLPEVRAERIGQCFRRPDAQDIGEILLDLEEDDVLRAAVVELLREIVEG